MASSTRVRSRSRSVPSLTTDEVKKMKFKCLKMIEKMEEWPMMSTAMDLKLELDNFLFDLQQGYKSFVIDDDEPYPKTRYNKLRDRYMNLALT